MPKLAQFVGSKMEGTDALKVALLALDVNQR